MRVMLYGCHIVMTTLGALMILASYFKWKKRAWEVWSQCNHSMRASLRGKRAWKGPETNFSGF